MSNKMVAKGIIEKILKEIPNNPELIYNEASLQFELAFRLRGLGFIVYVEKSICDADISSGKIKSKKEAVQKYKKERMDICVINGDGSKNAIELKFPPKNCNKKKRCEDFLKDIEFTKNIKEKLGFKKCFCLTLVSDESLKNKFSEIAKRKGILIQWQQDKLGNDTFHYLLEQ